ncbi:hypothetical protein ACB092_05G263800 [Castanea dentata]
MSLTGSHKNQLQIRCTERSQACLPALSLSLSLSPLHALSTTRHSVPNFRNPHTTAASPLSHHRSSALQTLTPPLIFCPSLPCLHCVRSLPHLGTPETHKEESQTPNSEHNPGVDISPQCWRQVPVAITPTIGGMCVTWISACCEYHCNSIISVDGFMAVDIGSL